MHKLRVYITLILFCLFQNSCSSTKTNSPKDDKRFYELQAKTIEGEVIDFSEFKGKVLLISNIALNCATTIQLYDFEKLNQKYKGKNFEILGIPSKDFSPISKDGQDEKQHIKKVCFKDYGVTFKVFEPMTTTGESICGLASHLIKSGDEKINGPVTFNFEKFLIGKDGKIRKRYSSFTSVMSNSFIRDLEELLNEN